MSSLTNALTSLNKAKRKEANKSAPFRAIVTGISGNLTTIQRLNAATPDSEPYAKIAIDPIAVSDTVLCMVLNGKPVILGKVYNSHTSAPPAIGGGGGGSVDSVNGKIGVVTLNADDISDAATSHKFVTAADVTNLGNLSGTNTGDQDLSGYALASSIPIALTDLDTTVSGAQLNALKTKVDGVAAGAEANVQSDWNAASGDAAILNKPTIPTQFNPIAGTNVTLSGTYPDITFNAAGGGGGAVDSVNGQTGVVVLDQDDIASGTTNKAYTATEQAKLSGIASGAEVNVQSDWNAVSGDAQILNKPTIPTAAAKKFGNGAGMTMTAAGTYTIPAAATVFTGLDPAHTYAMDFSVSFRAHSTGTNPRGAPGVQVTHAGGTSVLDTGGYISVPPGGSTVRSLFTLAYGGLYQPTAGGEITVMPSFSWTSESITIIDARLTVTVE